MKKIGSLVLAFIMLLSSFPILNLNVGYASGNVVKEITTDKTEIKQAESFRVDVKFGGVGTRVTNGQEEEILFSPDKVNITLPARDIPLNNSDGKNLGTVSFQSNKAIIKFNEIAAALDDVEGEFNFDIFGYYDGDMSQDGEGNITISKGNIKKDVKLIYKKGGISTDQIYSKKGVWDNVHKDGNRLEWVFNFNEAKKQTNGVNYNVKVEDELPNTMEWDLEKINTSPYILKLNNQWLGIEQARQKGFVIKFESQHLRIEIPKWINQNAYWVDPLDGKDLNIRLMAKVKDEVMLDTTVTHVNNDSTVNFDGLDWNINPDETHDSVKIIRQGGWANGTKSGELRITKIIKDKKIPIKDVEFTLKRLDGQDIEVKQENGSYLNMGSSLTLTTDEKGIANIKGLRPASYIVEETNAPEWIEYDVSQPISKEFTVGANDAEGTEYTIENKKKTVDVGVIKKWQDSSGQNITNAPSDVQVQLYRNNDKFGNPLTISTDKLTQTWEKLDKADDNGNNYTYSVKELDSEGNEVRDSIILDGKSYAVSISGSAENGFTITNKEYPKISVQVTKTWMDKENQDGKRPESVIIQLLADGKEVSGKTLTLTKANKWTDTFTNLDEYKSGQKIEYTVKEKAVGNGYTSETTGTAKDGYVVTNTREAEKVVVEGLKTWSDKNNQNGKRPTEITINLLKNGTKIDSIKVKEADGWKWKFKDLDKYENGQEIVYSISEEAVEGYSTEITGYNVKNSYTPGKTSVQVTKAWMDKENQDGKRPESVIIQLLADGKEVSGKTLTLTKANKWTDTFTNLDEYKSGQKIEYTVKEFGENNGSIKLNEKWFKVSYEGSMKDGFTVTNKESKPWIQMETPTRDIKVTKAWELLGREKPVGKIEVELYKDGTTTGKKIELNESNNWTGEFKGLEVADKLGSTDYYQYTVKEVGENNGSIKLEGKWFKVSYEGNVKDGLNIINKYEDPKEAEKPKSKDPKEPEKPEKDTLNKRLPQTGDTQDPFLYSILLGISGLGLLLLGSWKRKNEKKENI